MKHNASKKYIKTNVLKNYLFIVEGLVKWYFYPLCCISMCSQSHFLNNDNNEMIKSQKWC